MAAGPDLADHRRGGPFPLGAGDGDRAVGRRGPGRRGCGSRSPATSTDRPSARDPQQPLLARGGVEAARGVALEAADEVVAGGRGLVGVADALVEVGLAVAVEVVQPGDLVAAEDVDLAVGDDQAQRLVQARGDTAASGRARASRRAPRRARRRPASCRASPCRRAGSRGRRRRAGPSRGSRTAARSCRSRRGRSCRACRASSSTWGHSRRPPPASDAASGCSAAGATTRVNLPSSTQGASSISTSPIRYEKTTRLPCR